jgi:hypothetical protein
MRRRPDAPPAALPGRASPIRTVGSIRTAGSKVYLTQLLPFADKKSLPLYFEFEHKVYRHLA